jgi:hypothetical protein
VDGVELARDLTAPYEVVWDTRTAAEGPHRLQARAQDTAGNIGASAEVTVTVANAGPDTTPPTVTVTSPAAGAMVAGTVTVSASASDAGGVEVVQFLVDGVELVEDITAPYEVAWDTRTAAEGTHRLQARALDTAGNIGASAEVTVTVANAPPTPTRFEETEAALTGAWFAFTNADSGVALRGGRAVADSSAGARATFAFTGTGVTWIGFPCESCGFARVLLDNAVVEPARDTFAATRPVSSIAMFSRTGLARGGHTLVIEVVGVSNSTSTGSFIVVDAFDVVP